MCCDGYQEGHASFCYIPLHIGLLELLIFRDSKKVWAIYKPAYRKGKCHPFSTPD